MMTDKPCTELTILIKGAGEQATGVACRLFRAGMRQIVMVETETPLAVRRTVSFCEAVYDEEAVVEGITAGLVKGSSEINSTWQNGKIPIIVDPNWEILRAVSFDIVIDATIAKKNLGTSREDAGLVIGMGPGFTSGSDVDLVIETNRGHDLGRVLEAGQAEANTGIPGNIGGYTEERVLRAPCDGTFTSERTIGEMIKAGSTVGQVGQEAVTAGLDGVIRGLIRPGLAVQKGLKIGDIDPRGIREYCFSVSDKARALGGAVLEAILGHVHFS